MKRAFAIFLILMTIGHVANAAQDLNDSPGGAGANEETYYPENIVCRSTKSVHKCARLPKVEPFSGPLGNTFMVGSYVEGYSITDPSAIDSNNWSHIHNGIFVQGNVLSSETSPMGPFYIDQADCYTTFPFHVIYYAEQRRSASAEPDYASACANVRENWQTWTLENGAILSTPTALEGDICPDGFFTVPWESWCGEGMVNVSDAVSCDSDLTDAMYCLMPMDEVLCETGVSNLKTSTGLSFSLYAEKYTEPSLAVKYNGQICWAKLEAGQASNSININYQGTIYHVVD